MPSVAAPGRARGCRLRGTMIGSRVGRCAGADAPAAMPPQMMTAAGRRPKRQRSPWAPPADAAPPRPGPQPVVARAGRAGRRCARARRAGRRIAAPNAQPAGKKKPAERRGKGKFRETMWFKKGDLDAQAAVAAAEERARTGKDAATDKADSLPMDERYKDDGSISRGDKEKYSLRTGATQMMAAIKRRPRRGPEHDKVVRGRADRRDEGRPEQDADRDRGRQSSRSS